MDKRSLLMFVIGLSATGSSPVEGLARDQTASDRGAVRTSPASVAAGTARFNGGNHDTLLGSPGTLCTHGPLRVGMGLSVQPTLPVNSRH